MTIKRTLPLNKQVKDKVIKPKKVSGSLPTPIWLSSFINKLKRTSFQKGLKAFNPVNLIKSFVFWRKKAIRIVSIVLILALIIATAVFFKVKYDQISVTSLYEGEENIANLYNNKTQNILFINFDQGIDNNIFAKYISILNFNKTTNDLNILAVEPTLAVYYKGKNYTLESLFNNINENNVTKIANFQNILESLLGIRIDGYISTTNQDYSNFIINKGLGLTLNENFKKGNKFYQAGNYIDKEDLVSYLNLDGSQGSGSFLYRKNLFIVNTLQGNRNIFFSLSNYLNWEGLTQTFKTNLNKENTLRFYNDIFFQSNLPIKSQYILPKDGYAVDTASGIGLYVNQIDIDSKVQDVFRDLDLVKEQAKIEVLNGSTTPGLATVTKKIIQNSGGNVVNSGNYPTIESKTSLYLVDANLSDYANTIALLKSLYPDLEINEAGYKYNKLGNIILVIGSQDN